MRRALRQAGRASSVESLLGHEGEAAATYFSVWGELIDARVDGRLRYAGRSRRPPRDRVSALLGFGYALLLADVTAALLAVGLEPALGFYHAPRGSAPPLSLDLMELFRVPLVDMPVIASLNRGQWDPDADFQVTGVRVWLSDSGRRKLIEVYERRKAESWRHSVVGYSLTYARLLELEARLLEKEWTGAPGLFARFRLR
jgi:CRISPR-associated protein Cas1